MTDQPAATDNDVIDFADVALRQLQEICILRRSIEEKDRRIAALESQTGFSHQMAGLQAELFSVQLDNRRYRRQFPDPARELLSNLMRKVPKEIATRQAMTAWCDIDQRK